MRLLRFDPAGVLDASFGITLAQLASCHESLVRLRGGFSDRDAATYRGELRLPERLLTDYEAGREKSELGRVFRVANRLHDHLDAVAVIGDEDTLLGPTALMRACCEPYHNELSRSGRGSKPRMYFAPANFDNDVVDGLLRRLSAGGDGLHAAEQRYAVIAIDAPDPKNLTSRTTAASMQLIVDQLTESLGDGARRWLPKLTIPISPATGPVRSLADSYDCQHDFQSDNPLGGPLGIYSPALLLPAALLGLDCIQFLVGAAAMNDHFFTAPFPDNMVMQFVAVQLAMREFSHSRSSRLHVWNPALDGMTSWWNRYMSTPTSGGEWPVGRGTIHHLCVDTPRTDHLRVDAGEMGSELAAAFLPATLCGKPGSAPTLPELMQANIAKTIAAQRTAGQPSTQLMMASIDTHSIGQFFQFAWLVRTCLEGAD